MINCSSRMLNRKRIRFVSKNRLRFKTDIHRNVADTCSSKAETLQNSPVPDFIHHPLAKKGFDFTQVFFHIPVSTSHQEDFIFQTNIKNIEVLQKEILEQKNAVMNSNCNGNVPGPKENEGKKGEKAPKKTTKKPKQTGKTCIKRKYSLDSFHKKIKRHFFNFVLNSQIYFFLVVPKKKHQKHISDVSIGSVRELLSQNIAQFISKYCIINENCLRPRQDGVKFNVDKMLNCKLQDYFNEYLKSSHFQQLLNSNSRKENEEYAASLNQCALKFVHYFLTSKDLKLNRKK